MTGLWMAVGAVAACMLGWAVIRWWVPRLPEPDPDPDDPFVKPAYAGLVRPPIVIATMVLALAMGVLAPRAGWLCLAWVVFAGVGAALVVVDAATTYLPMVVHWAMALGVLLGLVVGLLVFGPSGLASHIVGAVAGFAACQAIFWLLWRLSGSFGFGDVRLAGLVGLLTGAADLEWWWRSLLLGTVLGAVLAFVIGVYRRSRPSPLGSAFPYGPALYLGPGLALLTLGL